MREQDLPQWRKITGYPYSRYEYLRVKTTNENPGNPEQMEGREAEIQADNTRPVPHPFMESGKKTYDTKETLRSTPAGGMEPTGTMG